MISERDAVLRVHAAFDEGARWQRLEIHAPDRSGEMADRAMREAKARHPLPKVERPRVVKDPHVEFGQRWRCVGGELQYTGSLNDPPSDHSWHRLHKDDTYHGCRIPTPERIRLWADLLANPTELVTE